MKKFLIELYKYRFLIKVLVVRDIKKKYRRSVLGVLWSVLNPILMMAVTSMVFSTIFRFDIPNYLLYLLTGQILFNFYAESTNFAMGSIIENSALIRKIYIPKYLFQRKSLLQNKFQYHKNTILPSIKRKSTFFSQYTSTNFCS